VRIYFTLARLEETEIEKPGNTMVMEKKRSIRGRGEKWVGEEKYPNRTAGDDD
jgi:hypothetical protein